MDCGGDCVVCMANSGDPNCIEIVKKYKKLQF